MICIYIYIYIDETFINNRGNLWEKLIDYQPETDAMAPFILGSPGGLPAGEYPKCVALPMVTWARMGLDMRNREFLRNSAAWGWLNWLFALLSELLPESTTFVLSSYIVILTTIIYYISVCTLQTQLPVSGQGLSLADLRHLEEKAKQLHQEGRANKGDVSDWGGVEKALGFAIFSPKMSMLFHKLVC